MLRKTKYIQFVLILEYIFSQLGSALSYPRELIWLIIRDSYQPIQVSCGEYHVGLINNNTYMWGSNVDGQLGLGPIESDRSLRKKNSPQKITMGDLNFKYIKCGSDHTMALTNSDDPNIIYVWGGNSQGQLGLGDSRMAYQPRQLKFIEPIIDISCGYYHSVCLARSGILYVWGRNECDQLGLGMESRSNIYAPQKLIIPNVKIIFINCGSSFTNCIDTNGNVWIWGNNKSYQLGLGNRDKKSVSTPTKLDSLSKITAISSGFYHSLALDVRGAVYTWGRNDYRQLGMENQEFGESPQQLIFPDTIIIKSVSCGGYHSMALTQNGEVYSWGLNGYGQLGHLEDKKMCIFIPRKIKLSNIMTMSCGDQFTILVTTDEHVYACGNNSKAQLGLGDTIYRDEPTEIVI